MSQSPFNRLHLTEKNLMINASKNNDNKNGANDNKNEAKENKCMNCIQINDTI